MKIARDEIPNGIADVFLRDKETTLVTGVKRSKRYQLIAAGLFPKPVRLGDKPNSPSGWSLREIEAWQRGQLAKRDAGPKCRRSLLADPPRR